MATGRLTLREQIAQGRELDAAIEKNLAKLGYGRN